MFLIRLNKHKYRPDGYYIMHHMYADTFLYLGIKDKEIIEFGIHVFPNAVVNEWKPMNNFEWVSNL